MNKILMENDIPVVLKQNKNTPRCALCFYFKINEPENKAGLYTILNRLFLQGTKNRSAEKLAQDLDENAIECYSEMKHDFIRFKLLCLNEDFDKGLEILEDIIKNSTLDDFDKEIIKIKGEIQAELDSPKEKALDAFYSSIYQNHPYGHTYTKVLKEIDSITKEEVIQAYKKLLNESAKVICFVGDKDEQSVIESLKKHFIDIQNKKEIQSKIPTPVLNNSEIVKIEKEDASQAQIIQGWHVPTIHDKDYAAIMVMNTMLGSSGLSSRLFLELREKKGLAYVVRSSYEVYDKAALFTVYIATEPKNIKTSLEGFKIELDKIKTVPVTQEELENAKNNLIGKRQFFTETNLQQAGLIAFYEDKGLGADFEEKLIENIKKVTIDDIKRVANLCIKETNVLTILAPKEYLKEI